MSLPTECIVQILLNLPYRDLLSYSSTHRLASQVCRDDYFWKLKVARDFKDAGQHKPTTISHREQYRDLISIGTYRASEIGRLDVLIALENKGIRPHQYESDLAAANGHLELLEWMESKGYPHPDLYGANEAAKNGQIKVLEWLEQRGYTLPNLIGANHGAMHGRIEVLNWLNERGIHPDQKGANWAALNGQLEALEWMEERRYACPDQAGANMAARSGHLEVLKWMERRGRPPGLAGANGAAENGHLCVLKWMDRRGYPHPNKHIIIIAAKNGHSDVVNWIHNNVQTYE